MLSCNEMTAALRVNVLWKYIFSEPARWLTGKAGELGWGLDDSSELLDAIYDIMQAVAADGRRPARPGLRPLRLLRGQVPGVRGVARGARAVAPARIPRE